jgi:hypothetical protein
MRPSDPPVFKSGLSHICAGGGRFGAISTGRGCIPEAGGVGWQRRGDPRARGARRPEFLPQRGSGSPLPCPDLGR